MENEKGNCYYFTHLAISFTEPKCFEEQVCSIIRMYYTYVVYWEKSRKRIVNSSAQNHPKHEVFLTHRPLQARLLPIYRMHCSITQLLLFYMGKVITNIQHFFSVLKVWRIVNEIWARCIFLKAMSIKWQLKRWLYKQMFSFRDNNEAICYTDKMQSVSMLKFNQLHFYNRSVPFLDCGLQTLCVHGLLLNNPWSQCWT